MQIGGVYVASPTKERAYYCKSIVIEVGGVSRYFCKVSWSVIDVALLWYPEKLFSLHPEPTIDLGRVCRQPMGNIPVTTTTKISAKVLQYKWEAYCNTNGGVHCDTNGRRTATQMGGVLKYFPFLRAQWHRKHCNTNWRRTAIQIGCVLQYFLE